MYRRCRRSVAVIEGDIRREKIIEIMSNQKEPVSGSDLAKKFSVSRQVIVQDIALFVLPIRIF